MIKVFEFGLQIPVMLEKPVIWFIYIYNNIFNKTLYRENPTFLSENNKIKYNAILDIIIILFYSHFLFQIVSKVK